MDWYSYNNAVTLLNTAKFKYIFMYTVWHKILTGENIDEFDEL